jgi:hypothetical protein
MNGQYKLCVVREIFVRESSALPQFVQNSNDWIKLIHMHSMGDVRIMEGLGTFRDECQRDGGTRNTSQG